MNTFKIKKSLVLLGSIMLSSCSLLDTHQLHPTAQIVKIFDSYEQVKDCQFISDLVGSEGTWYSFLFVSNKKLALASINDLKNQANALRANSIHIQNNFNFNTSVTLWGQAYHCDS